MKFSKEAPVKIVMLGAGGTGGHIAPHLYRLLYALNRQSDPARSVRFVIVDGDVVEAKNLIRQNFIHADLGENKAKVLAERYSSVFGLETEYVPEFIEDEEKLLNLVTPLRWQIRNRYVSSTDFVSGRALEPVYMTELVILIGAVDNNRYRALCHEVFHKIDTGLVYIDSGNGEHTGQVVCGIRRNGRTYYKPIGEVYPDVLADTDKFPTELSCAEASVSAPQSIVANIMAATVVVSYIYNILILGSIEVRSVTFSTRTVNLKPDIPHKRKRKSLAA